MVQTILGYYSLVITGLGIILSPLSSKRTNGEWEKVAGLLIASPVFVYVIWTLFFNN